MSHDICPVRDCRTTRDSAGDGAARKQFWEDHLRITHGLYMEVLGFNEATGGQGSLRPMINITAAAGLEVILRTIRQSDDPLKAAGEWLTLVTNGISELVKELPE